jgi:hypothetical protein
VDKTVTSVWKLDRGVVLREDIPVKLELFKSPINSEDDPPSDPPFPEELEDDDPALTLR